MAHFSCLCFRLLVGNGSIQRHWSRNLKNLSLSCVCEHHRNSCSLLPVTILSEQMLTSKDEHGTETAEDRVHRDSKGVAVGDFIVDNGLNVDGLQLEVNGHVNQPGDKEMTQS